MFLAQFRACGVGLLVATQLARMAAAQSIYGWDGVGLTVESTGPPTGAGCPSAPILSAFPTFVPAICLPPGPAAAPPAILGDLAVDKVTDTTWVTDGLSIGHYARSGALLDAFPSPLPALTGLGFDSAAGLLWITDGFVAAAIVPPAPPGCLAPPPPFAFLFPIGLPGGPATDIDWDAGTGTLWCCDVGGFVTNILIGGAIGPFGIFPAVPGPCGLAVPLQGIAVQASSALGPARIFVSDGFTTASLLPGGAPAPPTFAFPLPCTPNPTPQLGIGYAARGISYGVGADLAGLPAPVIGSIGQSIAPNPGFAITVSSAVPGSPAVMLLSSSALCPPLPLPGMGPLYLLPNYTTIPGVTTAAGTAVFVLPIPPPPGVVGGTWFTQVGVMKAVGVQVSSGLTFRITLP